MTSQFDSGAHALDFSGRFFGTAYGPHVPLGVRKYDNLFLHKPVR
jgi:hypothetical protein